jgi:hypothetical protein
VALTQQEADDFMQAEKVVPGSMPISWAQPSGGGHAMWRGPVEVDGARVGEVVLLVNPALERGWYFKLSFRGEEVYRLEAKNQLCNHNNPRNRPDGFPSNVAEPTHEHVYIEGLDCRCAQPLGNLASSDHAAIFEWFCTRTHVRIEPPYTAPSIPYQMPML